MIKMPEITRRNGKEGRGSGGGKKKPIKARRDAYEYVKRLKKQRGNESMMQTLSQICREHREQNYTPLEKLISEVDDLKKDAQKTEHRRALTTAKWILRMIGDGRKDVVDIVQDTLDQLEKGKQMMDAKNRGDSGE